MVAVHRSANHRRDNRGSRLSLPCEAISSASRRVNLELSRMLVAAREVVADVGWEVSRFVYLNNLSKAERASFTSATAVVVSRSTVLRASNNSHSLRTSFFGMRSGMGLRH